jgi:hypothetical protein
VGCEDVHDGRVAGQAACQLFGGGGGVLGETIAQPGVVGEGLRCTGYVASVELEGKVAVQESRRPSRVLEREVHVEWARGADRDAVFVVDWDSDHGPYSADLSPPTAQTAHHVKVIDGVAPPEDKPTVLMLVDAQPYQSGRAVPVSGSGLACRVEVVAAAAENQSVCRVQEQEELRA